MTNFSQTVAAQVSRASSTLSGRTAPTTESAGKDPQCVRPYGHARRPVGNAHGPRQASSWSRCSGATSQRIRSGEPFAERSSRSCRWSAAPCASPARGLRPSTSTLLHCQLCLTTCRHGRRPFTGTRTPSDTPSRRRVIGSCGWSECRSGVSDAPGSVVPGLRLPAMLLYPPRPTVPSTARPSTPCP